MCAVFHCEDPVGHKDISSIGVKGEGLRNALLELAPIGTAEGSYRQSMEESNGACEDRLHSNGEVDEESWR